MARSLEASISGDYQLFVYDTPKRDINIDLAVFPSLTDGGRVRTNLDIKFSWEIISDLMFQLSYWLNYDNRGADGEGETRDYGITTSIGYTY